jgi:hypothetical protein
MRVAVNLLTDDPHNPSGAHWFWTRVIPEMALRMRDDEELRLLVSPRLRSMHDGYPGPVSRLTFPWSNEHHDCGHSVSSSSRRSGCRWTASTCSAP